MTIEETQVQAVKFFQDLFDATDDFNSTVMTVGLIEDGELPKKITKTIICNPDQVKKLGGMLIVMSDSLHSGEFTLNNIKRKTLFPNGPHEFEERVYVLETIH